jgi:hypothetical protein
VTPTPTSTIAVNITPGPGSIITITKDGTNIFTLGPLANTNYHLMVTKSGTDLIVFYQSYDTFTDNVWRIFNIGCEGVAGIAYSNTGSGETKRFFSGWAEGREPMIAEILHTASTRTQTRVFRFIFD